MLPSEPEATSAGLRSMVLRSFMSDAPITLTVPSLRSTTKAVSPSGAITTCHGSEPGPVAISLTTRVGGAPGCERSSASSVTDPTSRLTISDSVSSGESATGPPRLKRSTTTGGSTSAPPAPAASSPGSCAPPSASSAAPASPPCVGASPAYARCPACPDLPPYPAWFAAPPSVARPASPCPSPFDPVSSWLLHATATNNETKVLPNRTRVRMCASQERGISSLLEAPLAPDSSAVARHSAMHVPGALCLRRAENAREIAVAEEGPNHRQTGTPRAQAGHVPAPTQPLHGLPSSRADCAQGPRAAPVRCLVQDLLRSEAERVADPAALRCAARY